MTLFSTSEIYFIFPPLVVGNPGMFFQEKEEDVPTTLIFPDLILPPTPFFSSSLFLQESLAQIERKKWGEMGVRGEGG